jgi:hypothetical protein
MALWAIVTCSFAGGHQVFGETPPVSSTLKMEKIHFFETSVKKSAKMIASPHIPQYQNPPRYRYLNIFNSAVYYKQR